MLRTFRLSALLATLALAVPVRAQNADTRTVDDGWVRELAGSLAASQASFRNWQEGGVSALAATARVEGAFHRLAGMLRLHHEARAAFGLVQQDTLPVRKAEDDLRYGFAAELRTSGVVRPSAAFSAQSQVAPGYDVSPDSADYPTLLALHCSWCRDARCRGCR